MAAGYCPSCGAVVEPVAKFCRRCGAQVGPGGPSTSPSEATTWTLDQMSQPNAGTQSVLAPNTAPAYISPQPYQPAAMTTNGLAQKKHTAAIILVLLFIVLVAVGAGFLTFELAHKSPTPSVEIPPPPPPLNQEGPSVPVPPNAPPAQPPAPPAAPGDGKSTGTSTTGEQTFESLRYPGSQTTFNIAGSNSGMMMLTTQDPIDKIIDWYSARIDVKTRVLKGGGATILTGKRFSVLITPKGHDTMIMVSEGSEYGP
jgi:zinc ribbon protein